MSEESGASRPRLQLKPRDETAARQLELQRTASGKNPFGDAKPREKILASRTGKSETEILKEEVKAEKPKLRLNAQQLEEKRAAEAAVAEIEELISAETDEAQKGPLQEELQARQAQLDELVAGFEKLAVEAAIKGEFVRPSERRRQQLEAPLSGNGYGTGDPRGDAGYGRSQESGSYQRGSGGYGGRGGYREGGSGYREPGGGYRDPAGYSREGGRGGRDGSFGGERRSGSYDRNYGGRGGARGFSNYEERPLDDEGRRGGGYQEPRGGSGGGGGYYDRDGGRSYEPREYRGPSDYDNVETFGVGAAGYGRDRPRGGGRGGRGRSDRPFNSYGSGGFAADDDYISPYSADTQDRF